VVASGALPLHPGGALPLHPCGGFAPWGAAGAPPPAPPAGRCPCTPAKRKGAGRPFSLGNLSSGLCAPCETICPATRSMGAPRSRGCPTACAPVAAHVCTTHRDEEHEAASGPSAAHSCTKDDSTYLLAAPGPSRTCASVEATRLGARNLWWQEETQARAAAAAAATATATAADSMGLRPSPWHETRSSPTSLSSFVAAAAAAASRQPPAASRQPPAASRQPPAVTECEIVSSRPPSYMRPAPWPHTMHKCARDPALPGGPNGRPLCTSVQRWDPTLPRAPKVSSRVHRCAATGAHAV
jgi:hypothetical protein